MTMTYDDFYNEYLTNIEHYAIQLPDTVKDKLARYFFLLMQTQEKMNLTAYRTVDDYVRYHLLDTLQLVSCIKYQPGLCLVDVGSGGGVPGILLAAWFEWKNVGLIESIHKKADFLRSSILEMEINEVQVYAERAETLAHDPIHREQYDRVTARALASLPQALELTAAFVKTGGYLFLPKGMSETAQCAEQAANTLGMYLETSHEYTLPGREDAFKLFIYKKETPTQEKYPRKSNQIQKNPLL